MGKKWKQIALGVAILAVVAFCADTMVGHFAQKKRQAQYQSQLASYRIAVKLGITRYELEAYLQSQHATFRHLCCLPFVKSGSGYADIVEIGSENPPWYCNHSNIYIAFEFPRDETQDVVAEPRGSDRLQNIELFPYLEECM